MTYQMPFAIADYRVSTSGLPFLKQNPKVPQRHQGTKDSQSRELSNVSPATHILLTTSYRLHHPTKCTDYPKITNSSHLKLFCIPSRSDVNKPMEHFIATGFFALSRNS